MALQKNDLQLLIEMQALCDKVLDQTEALAPMLETVDTLNHDIKRLEAFYDKDWLRLHDDKQLTDSDHEALRPHIKDGRYSILAQDTIWDAFVTAREIQLSLTKLLVKHL
ncbi:MAG: DUF4298 domain-containing protein [Stenotrophomonas sp.]|uniref:DUF4298 domain-containing protein n=1 Tax=Stenotrophomonas sp. TaxID=69392 RepID=UPI003D6C902D